MDFRAATVNALTLPTATGVAAREIAYWFALRPVAPIVPVAHGDEPLAYRLHALRVFHARVQPVGVHHRVLRTKPVFKGGHAVTPVSVRDGEGAARRS